MPLLHLFLLIMNITNVNELFRYLLTLRALTFVVAQSHRTGATNHSIKDILLRRQLEIKQEFAAGYLKRDAEMVFLAGFQ